tara:strand:- start:1507 stop:2109 length:603 start_codon:yes stop_codon:yes gene_type:complete
MVQKNIFYFLISLVLISLLSIMFYYYSTSEKKVNPIYEENINLNTKEISEDDSKSFIENITYISKDLKGNQYKITSETGYFDEKDDDIIFMTNVEAKILLKNNTTVYITSKKAKYDNKTSDTYFSENIKISYIDHKIFCDELNFMFTKNLMALKENIIYQSKYESFFADVMTMDLITKETKIFMNDQNAKVKFLKNNGYN